MALITAPASFLSRMSRADITLSRIDFETRSIFNSKRQVLAYPSGSAWRLSCDFVPMTDMQAGEWRAFFARMRGRQNWFQCPVPQYYGPTTGYTGPAGTVSGAGQVGHSLNVTGLTPSTPILRAGDFFTVNNQLKMAVENASSNGSGNATFTFEPALRGSPANGAALNLSNPYFLCAATDSDVASWGLRLIRESEFSFSGMEHIA